MPVGGGGGGGGGAGVGPIASLVGRDSTAAAIERIRLEREARRRSAESYRRDRAAEEAVNEREGNPGDVDFQRMIKDFREENAGSIRKVRGPNRLPSPGAAWARGILTRPKPRAMNRCRPRERSGSVVRV